MKVAIICNSFPTKKNKTNQIFIKNLVDQINDDRFELHIFYNLIYNLWGNASNYKSLGFNIIKYSFFFLSQLRLLLNIKSFSILNPHGVMISGFIAVIFKKIFDIPVLLHIHGGDLNIFKFSSFLYKKIYNYTVTNSDYVIVNSKDIELKLLRYTKINKEKTMILSPGIDYKIFYKLKIEKIKLIKQEYQIHPNKLVLFFAGNAIKRKGLDILVKAIRILDNNEKRKIHLLICSSGPELNSIKEEIQKITQFKNSYEFMNKVTQSELNILYNVSDLFIFPSREEPLGLVGLEAIAAGTPVIGSNIGGIKEYINQNNGFLFNPEKHYELRNLISEVLKNPKIISSIKNNIDKRKNEHDILITKEKYINKIIDLTTNNSPL